MATPSSVLEILLAELESDIEGDALRLHQLGLVIPPEQVDPILQRLYEVLEELSREETA